MFDEGNVKFLDFVKSKVIISDIKKGGIYMADICGQCIFLDPSDCKYGDRYYCKNKHTRVKVDERACSEFRKVGNQNSSDYQRAGCYITTVVCELLGYDDSCEVLEVLRHFRETVLKQDPVYLDLLLEYDQIGPIIADRLRNDNENKILAMDILRSFLIPCASSVKQNMNDEAVAIYKNMVQFLRLKYCLVGYDVDPTLESKFEDLGKGRVRFCPKKSECV